MGRKRVADPVFLDCIQKQGIAEWAGALQKGARRKGGGPVSDRRLFESGALAASRLAEQHPPLLLRQPVDPSWFVAGLRLGFIDNETVDQGGEWGGGVEQSEGSDVEPS